MRDLVVDVFVSLDGVAQAPGNDREDPDGFAHGGWTQPFFADHGRYVPESLRAAGAVLLGRRTYEIFASHWPQVTDPTDEIAHSLNTLPRYVASRTLKEPSWSGTTVLRGDVAARVAALKAQPGKDILVLGSVGLTQTLMAHDLVDEYRLSVHPVVLGTGKRLFRQGPDTVALSLVDTRMTASGLVLLTYRRASAADRTLARSA